MNEDLLQNLNQQQLEAVTHTDGPLLIVAGAGTGKTTVITRRIAWLMRQKLAKPEEILALTFTEKAASEMEERVDLLLPLGNYDLWISTFHSFCERILKQHGLDIGIPNDFKLLDDTKQWVLVYKNFDLFKLDYYRPMGNPSKFIDALLTHFSRCKDEIIKPEDYLKFAQDLRLNLDQPELISGGENEQLTEIKRIEELAGAYHTYQKLLLDNNFLDFGDLINYTLELFQKRPNILKYYQQKFKHILVDEFQDTNYAQYELVKLLADDHKNIVVVGDDDQSIYKFRGASVSNILKFKEHFPQLSQITLIENYRSSQEILDLAYNFIQANNPNRLEVELTIDKRLRSGSKKKAEIQVLEGSDLTEEIDLVIKSILTNKENSPKATWNDFAILIRSNSASEEVLPRLEANGIPFIYVANRGLFKKPLIASIINYLRLLDNYHDSSALYRVFQLPKFRVDAENLSTITQYTHRKTISVYQALKTEEMRKEISDKSKKILDELLSLLSKHTELLKDKTAVESFVQIIVELEITEALAKDTLENAQNRELLDQFYKLIEAYEQENEDKSLRGFLTYLDLELRAGNEGPINFDPNLGPEALKVLTIHSAKGLEFEYVYIINLVDQRFPTRYQRDAIEIPDALIKDILPEGDFHLQEERRLFYVAMTRAKSHLYFSWAKDYGGQRAKKPSQFLVETKLVPSEKVSKATGKVVFNRPKNKPKTQVFKKLPTSFSYSEIMTFTQCPLEYKYRIYLRLPMRGSPYFSFGSSIHKTFERFLKIYQDELNAPQQDLFGGKSEAKLPPFDVLEKLYEESWIDEWYENAKQKQEYRDKGKQLLKIFYDATVEKSPTPKYLEQFFKLKLGDYDFVGKIDRADQFDGGLQIIDYKTGKIPKTKGAEDVDQLKVYQWAAQDFLNEKVLSMCYWYVEENQFREIPVATAEELKATQDKLLATIHNIIEAVKFDRFPELHKSAKQHNCNFADWL